MTEYTRQWVPPKTLPNLPINMCPLGRISSLSSSFLPPSLSLLSLVIIVHIRRYIVVIIIFFVSVSIPAMLFTVAAPFLSDPILGDPFTSENGFTPWDCSELLYPNIINPQPQPPKPLGSSSGSGSDELNEPNPTNSNSGSDGPSLTEPGPAVADERKRRRMVSNRESARRSRLRKQKHLENLRNQLTRLRVENRELTNRLRCALYHCHGVKIENYRLLSEQSVLLQRLNNIKQTLMFRRLQQFTTAWPCNNNNNNNINMIINSAMMTSNEQIPSLIAS